MPAGNIIKKRLQSIVTWDGVVGVLRPVAGDKQADVIFTTRSNKRGIALIAKPLNSFKEK